MDNIYRSYMTAVLIGENFQSTLPDFLKQFFTAVSVYISAIEYITLKEGVLGAERAVSTDRECFSVVQSNLHHWGSFYGLCKDLSMNCLSFLLILLAPRLFWSFFWQKMLYNVLRNIYPNHLWWSFTHNETHEQIIHCQAILPSTHQSNPASEFYLRIFFKLIPCTYLRICIAI